MLTAQLCPSLVVLSMWPQDMTGEGRVELGRRALVREEFSVGSEMPGTWRGCPKKMLGTDQSLLFLKRKNGNVELRHRSAGRRVDRTHTRLFNDKGFSIGSIIYHSKTIVTEMT